VRGRGHDLRRRAHRPSDRQRKRRGARAFRGERVRRFVVFHVRNYRTRGDIAGWKAVEVAFQVPLHLPLRLDDEAEADRGARPACQQADPEGARVPQRIQRARTSAQFAQALRCPHQMVGFFARGVLELAPERRIRGGERLGAIEGLRAYLADVVDAHEGAGEATLCTLKLAARRRCLGRRARCMMRADKRPQGGIGDGDQAVKGSHARVFSIA